MIGGELRGAGHRSVCLLRRSCRLAEPRAAVHAWPPSPRQASTQLAGHRRRPGRRAGCGRAEAHGGAAPPRIERLRGELDAGGARAVGALRSDQARAGRSGRPKAAADRRIARLLDEHLRLSLLESRWPLPLSTGALPPRAAVVTSRVHEALRAKTSREAPPRRTPNSAAGQAGSGADRFRGVLAAWSAATIRVPEARRPGQASPSRCSRRWSRSWARRRPSAEQEPTLGYGSSTSNSIAAVSTGTRIRTAAEPDAVLPERSRWPRRKRIATRNRRSNAAFAPDEPPPVTETHGSPGWRSCNRQRAGTSFTASFDP